MSLVSIAKIAAVDAETFLKNLLPKLEGTPAVQQAELAGVDTLKGAIEAAIAPYVGPLDPEVNAALDSFANLLKSKIEAQATAGSSAP